MIEVIVRADPKPCHSCGVEWCLDLESEQNPQHLLFDRSEVESAEDITQGKVHPIGSKPGYTRECRFRVAEEVGNKFDGKEVISTIHSGQIPVTDSNKIALSEIIFHN